jgi:hypothetical protein
MKKIDTLFSVCEKKDLATWRITSRNVINCINSKKYVVIVPDGQVKEFRAFTPGEFDVVSEDQYTKGIGNRLKEKIQASGSSYNWYLQQFIKMSALYQAKDNELNLIWDADTVPLKKLNFSDGKSIKFYIGSEHHEPYFDTTERLLGYGKLAKFSWIAQCFPCRGRWIADFISYIENKHSKIWVDCLIDTIDFSVSSSFSEYETLGGFLVKNYPDEITIIENDWLRYGNGILGSPEYIRYFGGLLGLKYDYIAFENWDKKWSWYGQKIKNIVG